MDFDALDNLYLKLKPSFADRVIDYANQQAKWQEYLHVDADNINSSKLPSFTLYKPSEHNSLSTLK